MSKQAMLFFALLMFISCGQKEQQQAPPPGVTIVEVKQKDVPIIDEFVGQTYGQSDIAIRARVDGFLEGVHFQEGSQVKKGQLLYSIDPAPQMARVTEAMSKVAEAKTILAKAESDVTRYRPLAEINAVAQSDLDAAEAQYGAAKASLEAANASLDYANIQLSYTKIYSPINGFIGKTEAKVGDYVGREPNPVVLNEVSNIDTILVQFSISETEYLKVMQQVAKLIEKGEKLKKNTKQPLELILADGSIYKYDGYVDFANRQIDPTTGTMLIQASFPNPDKVLRPGLYGKVRATMNVIKDALLIPQKAIMEIQGIYNIYVVDTANTIQIKQVKVGEKFKADWIILEGLNPSDRVIVEGLQKVRTGQKVSPTMMNQNSESN
ncbi:MAG: efflux RND transporter periplasmic adaptor subunit [Bacteroidetes bacterium]|nr:efflux RND transporter periplasmic adaptor subunit [Bacteroidota bacterium]